MILVPQKKAIQKILQLVMKPPLPKTNQQEMKQPKEVMNLLKGTTVKKLMMKL